MERNRKEAFVAVDPGTTTGLALCVEGDGDSPHERLLNGRLEVMEIRTANGDVTELADTINAFFKEELMEWTMGTVVIEDFILRTADKKRKTMDPIRVTHALTAVLKERGWVGDVKLQQPSAAKTVVNDDRLKRWGLWIKGKVHGRDAVRHAIIYLRSNA